MREGNEPRFGRRSYRMAIERGDPEALANALARDVTLSTPLRLDPVKGVQDVVTCIFESLFRLQNFRFTDEIDSRDGKTKALTFKADVSALNDLPKVEIQVRDLLKFDQSERVSEIATTARPIQALSQWADAVPPLSATVSPPSPAPVPGSACMGRPALARAAPKGARLEPRTVARKVMILVAPVILLIGCLLYLRARPSDPLSQEIRGTLSENLVIRRHIGTIDQIKLHFFPFSLDPRDWLDQLGSGRIEVAFRVQGEKSSGVVQVTFINKDGRIVPTGAGTLKLPTGVRYDLMADSLPRASRGVPGNFERVVAGGTEATRLRFVDQEDGTVKDTDPRGLIWLKDANCFGKKTWQEAMQVVARLKGGVCGLADGSKAGDWRLPTKEEWETMVAPACPTAPKIVGNGGCYSDGAWAAGVQSSYYWSSTREHYFSTSAWDAILSDGSVANVFKDYKLLVWPVRGGW